jgi:dimethylargininase
MVGDTALVRGVPDSFAHALRADPDEALDVDRARRQHTEYVALLASAGYSIEEIAPDEAHPDCVFVEDTAVVLASTAVITRSGAPSRRGEVAPVAAFLSPRLSTTAIAAPGTLDGGDVMVLGTTVYIGRTARTNQAGIDQLSSTADELGFELIMVAVHQGLHLKSVVLPLDEESVLVTPGTVDEEPLKRLRIRYEADSERHRCSALPLRDGRLLVTEGAPATMEMLAAAGHDLVAIDVSELQMADGGLTCLSILFRPE